MFSYSIVWACMILVSLITDTCAYGLYGVTNQTFSKTFSMPLSLFSIQDALFPADSEIESSSWSYDDTFLFTDACRQADGSSNCTISCSNNATVFENLETLHNCMFWQEVSFKYGIKNLTSEQNAVVETLGIVGDKTNSSTSVTTDVIRRCLVDYCANNVEGCQAYVDDSYSISPFTNYTAFWNESEGRELMQAICDSSSYPVNPDIGGIGVPFNTPIHPKNLLIISRCTSPTGFRPALH